MQDGKGRPIGPGFHRCGPVAVHGAADVPHELSTTGTRCWERIRLPLRRLRSMTREIPGSEAQTTEPNAAHDQQFRAVEVRCLFVVRSPWCRFVQASTSSD